MRDNFPPNFRMTVTFAAVVIAMFVGHALISSGGLLLGRLCCSAFGVLWLVGFMVLTARGLYLTDTHLVQYWLRPEYAVKRIRLTRIVDLNRTVRATYITAASGRVLVIGNGGFVRYYGDLLPSLQARVGPNVPVTDTQVPRE